MVKILIILFVLSILSCSERIPVAHQNGDGDSHGDVDGGSDSGPDGQYQSDADQGDQFPSDADHEDERGSLLPECDDSQIQAIREEIHHAVEASDTCFSGEIRWSQELGWSSNSSINGEYCSDMETSGLLAESEQRASEGLPETLSETCHIGEFQTFHRGGAQQQIDSLRYEIFKSCKEIEHIKSFLEDVRLEFDELGRLVAVEHEDEPGHPTEADDCVYDAVSDLFFPCLSGMAICFIFYVP